MHHPQHPVFLRTALVHAARTLEAMGHKGQALEEAVGDAVREGPEGRAKLRRALQGLDHLVQAVGDMARFIAAISEQTASSEEIDLAPALKRVLLRDMMAILAGMAETHEDDRPHKAGDVDFF